jgi:hypothetical protein
VRFLCRRLYLCAYRSDGARTVKNGSAQMRPAHGTSGSSMIESHRKAARFDKMAMRRADRVSIEATGLGLGTPSPLDRVVEVNDNRASW